MLGRGGSQVTESGKTGIWYTEGHMAKLRVLVISGGPSSEHEVSLASGQQVVKHLDRRHYIVTSIVITKKGLWKWRGKPPVNLKVALRKIAEQKYNIAFLALHGEFGEDGQIQELFDKNNILYTGSGPAACKLAMNKDKANRRFQKAALPVPPWKLVKNVGAAHQLPAVVKPIGGGSAIDTHIVRSEQDYQQAIRRVLKKYKQVIVQYYILGRELSCGVIEDTNGRPRSLPPTEIFPKTSSWYDYHARYTVGASLEITPAKLSPAQTATIKKIALRAHLLLKCGGMSRSDFIFDGEEFWILETNTIPGLTSTSLLPQEADAAGLSFSQMLDLIMMAGLRRKAK